MRVQAQSADMETQLDEERWLIASLETSVSALLPTVLLALRRAEAVRANPHSPPPATPLRSPPLDVPLRSPADTLQRSPGYEPAIQGPEVGTRFDNLQRSPAPPTAERSPLPPTPPQRVAVSLNPKPQTSNFNPQPSTLNPQSKS